MVQKVEHFRKKKFNSFHEAIGPILVLGQMLGTMPIQGVLDRDIDSSVGHR